MRSFTCPHCGECLWLREDVDVLTFMRTPGRQDGKRWFVIIEAGVLKHRSQARDQSELTSAPLTRSAVISRHCREVARLNRASAAYQVVR